MPTQANYQEKLQQAANHLSAHDPVMAKLVQRFGRCTIVPHSDYYLELTSSIISQQLSVKAADTIWKRFLALFDNSNPMPQEVADTPIEKLRTAGLSQAKAAYIKDLAAHILDERLEINKFTELDNQQIINELTAIKGIGEWTAHMFLMFSLGRLDILATGDVGIRNGVQQLYALPSPPTPTLLRSVADSHGWHPYETVACWYIWHYLDNAPTPEAA